MSDPEAGSALQAALSRAGYEVRSATRSQIVPTAAWADLIILAVPFGAVPEVARELGTAADGKTVVDITNALTPDFQLAIGFTTSGCRGAAEGAPTRECCEGLQYGIRAAHEHG